MLAATLALTACTALLPARDPKPGELIGTWKNGSTVLTVTDDSHFEVKGLSPDHVYGAAGDVITVSGRYSISDVGRIENRREIDFGYIPATGETGGTIQAAFDPTTDPVSLLIFGGSPKDPQYVRLTKQG